MDFEKKVAEYIGAKYAVALNSCTSALTLALRLSGISRGDKVICPAFTCMATANAIHHSGANPVFCDIDPRTYNLDPGKLKESIVPGVKAVMLVHQIGLPADRDKVKLFCDNEGLLLLEDAACSFGASYHDVRLGGHGTPTAFSFHPRKMITTGEGGMLVTESLEMVEKARILRSAGASVSDMDRHNAKGVIIQKYADVGYNYRMTDLQAAIGLVQMEKVDNILKSRREQALKYNDLLCDVEEVDIPYEPLGILAAYSSYIINLKGKFRLRRNELLQRMAEEGISCRAGIQPLHKEPYYQEKWKDFSFPVSEEKAETTMFLPIFPGLREEEQELVVEKLKVIIAGK